MKLYNYPVDAHWENYKETHEHVVMQKYKFVGVMPGEKSHDGGEYGFYTELRPTRFTNVFQVWTSTSCDFDDCGTGFEGYAYLTREDLDKMRYESDKIIAAGSQY